MVDSDAVEEEGIGASTVMASRFAPFFVAERCHLGPKSCLNRDGMLMDFNPPAETGFPNLDRIESLNSNSLQR